MRYTTYCDTKTHVRYQLMSPVAPEQQPDLTVAKTSAENLAVALQRGPHHRPANAATHKQNTQMLSQASKRGEESQI
jgi:hypothetical protein